MSLQRLGSLPGCGFDPWPRNFYMLWAWATKLNSPEMKKKGKRRLGWGLREMVIVEGGNDWKGTQGNFWKGA